MGWDMKSSFAAAAAAAVTGGVPEQYHQQQQHQQELLPLWGSSTAPPSTDTWEKYSTGALPAPSTSTMQQQESSSKEHWELSWDNSLSSSHSNNTSSQIYFQQQQQQPEHHHHEGGELKSLISLSSAAAAAAASSMMRPGYTSGIMLPSSSSYGAGGSSSSYSQSPFYQAGTVFNNSSSSSSSSNSNHRLSFLDQTGSAASGNNAIMLAAGISDMNSNSNVGGVHDFVELRTFEQRRNYFGLMALEQRAQQMPPYVKREDLCGDHWLHHGRIGLNLGGRTYFSSADDSVLPRFGGGKRTRLNGQVMHVPLCQAEGCTADLSKAKHYHRRHKVCEVHSKAPTVVANGQTQRFCQQCSRFHSLGEFDDSKRSCRKRLADHNRRRRKPPQIASSTLTEAKAESNEASVATHSSADHETKAAAFMRSSLTDDSDSKQLNAVTTVKIKPPPPPPPGCNDDPTTATTVSTSDPSPDSGLMTYGNADKAKPMFSSSSSNHQQQPCSSSGGPNLSLSSSLNSSFTTRTASAATEYNQSSQSSIEHHQQQQQPSWLKSATTTRTAGSSSRSVHNVVKSHSFHDLISPSLPTETEAEQHQQPRCNVGRTSSSCSSAAQVFSPSNKALAMSMNKSNNVSSSSSISSSRAVAFGTQWTTSREQPGQLHLNSSRQQVLSLLPGQEEQGYQPRVHDFQLHPTTAHIAAAEFTPESTRHHQHHHRRSNFQELPLSSASRPLYSSGTVSTTTTSLLYD